MQPNGQNAVMKSGQRKKLGLIKTGGLNSLALCHIGHIRVSVGEELKGVGGRATTRKSIDKSIGQFRGKGFSCNCQILLPVSVSCYKIIC